MERRLSRLPRRTLERVPADAASPRWVAEAFSTYLVNKWGVTTWLAYASSHRREYGKWKRVTALRILFHIAYEDILPLLERALIDRDQDVVGAAVVILGDMESMRRPSFLLTLFHASSTRHRVSRPT